jgi:hypothetical protein
LKAILTYVHWRDACTEEAADPATPVSDHPLVDLHEVGWLIAETDESVSIAMELEPHLAPGRWRLHIPKCNILERINFDSEKLFASAVKKRRAKGK